MPVALQVAVMRLLVTHSGMLQKRSPRAAAPLSSELVLKAELIIDARPYVFGQQVSFWLINGAGSQASLDARELFLQQAEQKLGQEQH